MTEDIDFSDTELSDIEEEDNIKKIKDIKFDYVPDNERLSYNKLTKYEYTAIINERMKQLNSGSTPLVNFDDCANDIEKIAIKELKENKLPFKIVRPIGNNLETFNIQDLIMF